MRTMWIVAYDICDPRRLRRVASIMEGFGTRVQYSVFECHLTEADRVRLCALLRKVIDNEEDQVLFISLGPSESKAQRDIRTLGRPYAAIDSPAFIV